MKKGFTITELLVAVGLLAVVLAVTSMIFNYSIDAQRTAAATSEIMRTLRAIMDQLKSNLGGLQDGFLVLYSSNNQDDALYFFCTGDFQSWYNTAVVSNTARVYFGPSGDIPSNLALDLMLLDCSASVNDYSTCSMDPVCLGENPITVLSTGRPPTNIAANPYNAGRILAQNVGSVEIEWTYGWFRPPVLDKIVWWGLGNPLSVETTLQKPDSTLLNAADITLIATAINETPGPPYTVQWDPTNLQYWPKALKFTFTLYDSKGILENGRKFEQIVYIGN